MANDDAVRKTVMGAAVLLHRDGLVLLQKRTIDAPSEPRVWSAFGGHGEPGEEPAEAAAREVEEELGIVIEPDDLAPLHVFWFEHPGVSVVLHYFSAELRASLSDIRLGEGAGFALFAPSEVTHLDVSGHAREAVERLAAGWD